jgi:TRAP-type C4-dicarboxylate transport system permease small subunit
MVWVKVGSTGTQTSSDLRLPLVWFYAVGALGATVAALLGALRAIELARGRLADADATVAAAESSNGS